MRERQQPPSYPLRMDAQLRARLDDAARDSRRSMNAEIVARLEKSLEPNTSSSKDMIDIIDLLIAMGKAKGLSVEVAIRKLGDDDEAETEADD